MPKTNPVTVANLLERAICASGKTQFETAREIVYSLREPQVLIALRRRKQSSRRTAVRSWADKFVGSPAGGSPRHR